MIFNTLQRIAVAITISFFQFFTSAQCTTSFHGEIWCYELAWGDTLEATIFTLNSKNKPVSSTTYIKNTYTTPAVWEIDTKEIIVYKTDDTTIQSAYALQYYSSTGRCDTTIFSYTYNLNNQPVRLEAKTKTLGTDATVTIDFWYDGNNISGDSILLFKPASSASATPAIKHIYAYTVSTTQISEFFWDTNSKTWIEYSIATTVFDSSNRALTRTVQREKDSNGIWLSIVKDTFIYSGTRLTEEITQIFNYRDGTWTETGRTMHMLTTPPGFLIDKIIKFKKDFTRSHNAAPNDNRRFDLRGRYMGNSIKKTDAFIIYHQRSNTGSKVKIK